VSWRLDDAQRSIHRVAKEISQKFCDQPVPRGLGHLRAQRLASLSLGDE
jgi:hypothetical protein